MDRTLVLKSDIAASLRVLGLEPGDVVWYTARSAASALSAAGRRWSLRRFWSASARRAW